MTDAPPPGPEYALDRCRAIVHHLEAALRAEMPLEAEKIALIMADYGSARRRVDERDREPLDRSLLHLFAPMSAWSDGRPELVPIRTDVAIVTVISEELDATLRAFDLDAANFTQPVGSNRRFYETELRTSRAGRPISVVVTSSVRSGNPDVGPVISELRTHYNPSVWLLVGVAGGHRDHVGLGSVVLPEWVHFYEPGRVTDKQVQSRNKPVEIAESMFMNFRYYRPIQSGYYERIADFMGALGPGEKPEGLDVTFRPEVITRNIVIGSGELAVRSQAFMDDLYRHNAAIKVVDQESYGFGANLRGQHWAIVRGISDFGRSDESMSQDSWKFAAAGFAAVLVRNFLETQFVLPRRLS
ncbi:hypothetical protein ACPB67_07585 [Micromonospora taraxaci]|uniref:phosphorylase family protein n=1 Tax=Micromonospora taraxaci TaxID=1316803 RepID=UPI003C2DA84C